MFHRRQKLRFQCTGCGACCIGNPNHYYIAAGRAEQDRIRTFLGMSKAWFRRRYIVKVDEDTEGIRMESDGRCTFLDRANQCRVYRVRPKQCRTYPFWPEVLATRSSWQTEAKTCEGIGRGAVIPLKRIETALETSAD